LQDYSALCFEQDYWILGFAGLGYKCQHLITFARGLRGLSQIFPHFYLNQDYWILEFAGLFRTLF